MWWVNQIKTIFFIGVKAHVNLAKSGHSPDTASRIVYHRKYWILMIISLFFHGFIFCTFRSFTGQFSQNSPQFSCLWWRIQYLSDRPHKKTFFSYQAGWNCIRNRWWFGGRGGSASGLVILAVSGGGFKKEKGSIIRKELLWEGNYYEKESITILKVLWKGISIMKRKVSYKL